MHLQKLYAAERHFSNTDKRKKTRTALFTLLLCAYLNRNKSSSAQFLCFRVHSRTHKTDFVQRVAQGVSHKVANSLQGPASTPRSERRERGARETNTHFTYSPQSKLGKLLEVNKHTHTPPYSQKATQAECFYYPS